jgi:hypothetical protein
VLEGEGVFRAEQPAPLAIPDLGLPPTPVTIDLHRYQRVLEHS